MTAAALEFDVTLDRPGFSLAAEGRLEPGVTALFGHSGCGKTSLLRCLAGLERGCRGTIRHGEQPWQSRAVALPPHRRAVGLVFQDARLFPHLSVRGNLDYAERRRREDGPGRAEVIDGLGLRKLLDQAPSALSGGEAQRVALGRALLAGPRLLLLDEPLTGLDSARQREIMPLLRTIPERFGIPVLYVTHARHEVLALADRIMLMREGGVLTHASVSSVFSSPDYWALLGQPEPVVIWPGRVVARDNDWGLTVLATDAGRLRISEISADPGDPVALRVAARDVVLTLEPPTATSMLNSLPVRVESLQTVREGVVRVQLGVGHKASLWTEVTRQSVAALRLETGRRIHALIRPEVLGLDH
ncbi:molybdenum ABC transporter ATP-binding protein [Spiribacter vilamensis]|uniref:Molybdate transport system ATP-binding protein n=1 Tax=Spiribacter vilamensis TaxID=531306 RepID=A0A4Q8D216_9GAMM|nr:molybdenum ABC transporter ATP-binding protein [Spiribacter vilamensis]RZU99362.1 molybdate transport system ATP-binding protein [Spiribacter vilamensis]TVO61657.1 molybdenum ABC transporter ATP-binding protein [Spiribacter vilamensis]